MDEKGYKLIFKPHPEIREFVDLFDSENIIISTDETYQELLNPSSMLITDYSGTFFDFGYLKNYYLYKKINRADKQEYITLTKDELKRRFGRRN